MTRTLELRSHWINYARDFALQAQVTHPNSSILPLPRGGSATLGEYGDPILDDFESRLREAHKGRSTTDGEHIVLASGMAAISSLLFVLRDWWRPSPQNPMDCVCWGSYFETVFQLETLEHGQFSAQLIPSQDKFLQAVAEGIHPMVTIDPVAYSWEMDVLDLDAFVEAWNQRPEVAGQVLVLDTTLVGETFPVQELRSRLKNVTLFCHMASGLKLDQRGIELNNVGFLSLYANDKDLEREFAAALRQLRTELGYGISYREMCEFDTEFFLKPDELANYGEKVYLNNQFLAQNLDLGEGKIFERVRHPSLSARSSLPWAVAPFVVFHLADDALVNQGLLLEVLNHECELRGIPFHTGASFGFRFHRYEVIVPNYGLQNPGTEGKEVHAPRSLFKVAMGSNQGPLRARIVDLINEVASASGFGELRSRYKDRSTLSDVTQMNMSFRVFCDPEEELLRLTPGELAALTPEQKETYTQLPEILTPDERYWGNAVPSTMTGFYNYGDLEFMIPETVMTPGTSGKLFFDALIDGVVDVCRKSVFYVGIGPGVESVLSARLGAKKILATDIHTASVDASRANFERHQPGDERARFVVSDLLDQVEQGEQFDLISFNPPTIPLTFRDEFLSRVTFVGTEIAYRFLDQIVAKDCLAPGGEIVMVLSNACDITSISTYFIRRGFFPTVVQAMPWHPAPEIAKRGMNHLISYRRAGS